MKLELVRYDIDDKRAIGRLMMGGVFVCYTLEDPPRAFKIPGITGIPDGTYDVILNESARFKKRMPLILDVPDFRGVRIHCGNTVADTHGCILVGMSRRDDTIADSRRAFDSVMGRLEYAHIAGEPITLTISRETPKGDAFDKNGDLTAA